MCYNVKSILDLSIQKTSEGRTVEINLNNLNRYNLLSLRVLARKLGINAPTVKRKAELINEIKKASAVGNGGEQHGLKRGRPCLSSLDADQTITFPKEKRIEQIQSRYIEKINQHFERFIMKVTNEKNAYLSALENLFNDEN